MTPASRVNVTFDARPSAPVSSTLTALIWLDHSGYALKSAMTAMTSDFAALIEMLDVAWSAMRGPYYLPLEDIRSAAAAEVPDVDALGPPDPGTTDQRVVHVPEQHRLRLGVANRVE